MYNVRFQYGGRGKIFFSFSFMRLINKMMELETRNCARRFNTSIPKQNAENIVCELTIRNRTTIRNWRLNTTNLTYI